MQVRKQQRLACQGSANQGSTCHPPASSPEDGACYKDAIEMHTSREPSTLGSNSCS